MMVITKNKDKVRIMIKHIEALIRIGYDELYAPSDDIWTFHMHLANIECPLHPEEEARFKEVFLKKEELYCPLGIKLSKLRKELIANLT